MMGNSFKDKVQVQAWNCRPKYLAERAMREIGQKPRRKRADIRGGRWLLVEDRSKSLLARIYDGEDRLFRNR